MKWRRLNQCTTALLDGSGKQRKAGKKKEEKMRKGGHPLCS
jgi:hypothetical protein